MSSVEDILRRDGILVYKTRGRSMEPLLRQERDLVIIRTPAERLSQPPPAVFSLFLSYHREARLSIKYTAKCARTRRYRALISYNIYGNIGI